MTNIYLQNQQPVLIFTRHELKGTSYKTNLNKIKAQIRNLRYQPDFNFSALKVMNIKACSLISTMQQFDSEAKLYHYAAENGRKFLNRIRLTGIKTSAHVLLYMQFLITSIPKIIFYFY